LAALYPGKGERRCLQTQAAVRKFVETFPREGPGLQARSPLAIRPVRPPRASSLAASPGVPPGLVSVIAQHPLTEPMEQESSPVVPGQVGMLAANSFPSVYYPC
jgi:hypothetical protein